MAASPVLATLTETSILSRSVGISVASWSAPSTARSGIGVSGEANAFTTFSTAPTAMLRDCVPSLSPPSVQEVDASPPASTSTFS